MSGTVCGSLGRVLLVAYVHVENCLQVFLIPLCVCSPRSWIVRLVSLICYDGKVSALCNSYLKIGI